MGKWGPSQLVPMSSSRSVFLAVFASAVVAGLVGLLLQDYIRVMRERNSRQNLFPDPGYLTVVEETAEVEFLFSSRPTTQLQQRSPTGLQPGVKECEAEALKTLSAAINSKREKNSSGKSSGERAKKLFDHAINLCPKHPKVLVSYGEFLETHERDLIAADHQFARAIAFSEPGSEEHLRAIANRRRTSLAADELDVTKLRIIDDKKMAFQAMSLSSNSAMKRAKKEAYFQHIFHSVGIEGNTMTLSQTRSVLETKVAVAGKSVMEHNEVLGLDLALRFINQTLVDRLGEITLDDILQIHKRVIGYVDPLEAGIMRRTQVYVGDYVPPHPSDVDLLMAKFIEWINSSDNADIHPIRFAALAHYKLVYIHPFVDGNGRTSRLLMNLILMQSGFPPVIIRKQDRLSYYQHLVSANEGDIRPFVRFIAECAERTLDAYLAAAIEHPPMPLMRVFDDESEKTIIQTPAASSVLQHLDHTDKIIMGGMVGVNVSVEP